MNAAKLVADVVVNISWWEGTRVCEAEWNGDAYVAEIAAMSKKCKCNYLLLEILICAREIESFQSRLLLRLRPQGLPNFGYLRGKPKPFLPNHFKRLRPVTARTEKQSKLNENEISKSNS